MSLSLRYSTCLCSGVVRGGRFGCCDSSSGHWEIKSVIDLAKTETGFLSG